MDAISQKRHDYETTGPEYEKYFFDDQTGGYVLIHQGHNRQPNFESELFLAKIFSTRGRAVLLVNEKQSEKIKSPDAEIALVLNNRQMRRISREEWENGQRF